MSVNQEYKDSVFVSFFSDKARLIELYHAIAGKKNDNSLPVNINTLSDTLFVNRKNDISFLLAKKIVVFDEHQSTINENLGLRFLIYLARVYEKIINNNAMYRRSPVKLPRPEFIVLYHGPNKKKQNIPK